MPDIKRLYPHFRGNLRTLQWKDSIHGARHADRHNNSEVYCPALTMSQVENPLAPHYATVDESLVSHVACPTRSHPQMVGNMSRVTLNFDLSKTSFVLFFTYTHTKN